MLDYQIPAYSQGETAQIDLQEASEDALKAFAEVFCENLNTIYQVDGKQFYPLQIIFGPASYCFRFSYGEKPASMEIIEEPLRIENLLNNQQEAAKYKRVLKIYSKEVVSLIKPKTLRYWLKSIAIRDAIDVMQDLVESGY
jgi:hypothetical protein